MMDNTQTALRPLRLNPFAFPSDTDVRFVLLIVAVLGSSLFIYNVLSLNIQKKAIIAASACAQQHIGRFSALQQCLAPFTRIQITWEIGGVFLVLAIAAAIYWIFPTYMLRRRKLVPLSVDDAPEVVAYLSDLYSALCVESAHALEQCAGVWSSRAVLHRPHWRISHQVLHRSSCLPCHLCRPH